MSLFGQWHRGGAVRKNSDKWWKIEERVRDNNRSNFRSDHHTYHSEIMKNTDEILFARKRGNWPMPYYPKYTTMFNVILEPNHVIKPYSQIPTNIFV